MSIQRKHLRQYARLFLHRRDIYAVQRADGSYFLLEEPITAEVLQQHLAGERTCGWYALESDNTVRWVALDADEEGGLAALQEVWQKLRQFNIAAYLENSRRGGHLWVFVEPIRAVVVYTLMEQVLGLLEISDVEIYPRQIELPPGGVGSLVRGPLGIHQLTGERYDFLDPVQLKAIGLALVDQLDYLESVQVNPVHRVAEALAEVVRQPRQPDEEITEPVSFEQDKVEELKAKIGDLYIFVSQYVELDAKGRGSCPFHPPDRNPSFAVNRDEGYWVCFHETNPETGRYLGGDAIEFYKRYHGLSFKEAMRELADQYGVEDLPF